MVAPAGAKLLYRSNKRFCETKLRTKSAKRLRQRLAQSDSLLSAPPQGVEQGKPCKEGFPCSTRVRMEEFKDYKAWYEMRGVSVTSEIKRFVMEELDRLNEEKQKK